MHPPTPELRPVYAVVGRDRFLRNEAVDRILHGIADEMDTLGPTRVDGVTAQLADVLDEVRTISLLAGRRVVIVDDADSLISANRRALERYCESPSDSGCLILVCNALASNTRLSKIITERGLVNRCEPPKGRGIFGWIIDRARETYGKRLSPGGAQQLREHVGDALGVLDAELAKLAAFVGQRDEIAPADIGALTGHHREERVFAVADAMAANDPATALGHWEQVLATDRAAPARAIAGLAWGVRRLLEARRDWEAGADLRTLARRMYTDPGVLKQRLDRVTIEELEGQQRDLLAADLAVKTGASTVDSAVEMFIVKHSMGRSDAPAVAGGVSR